jgi:hypothetical protein
VSNAYQKESRRAQPGRQRGEIPVPEQVIVSMAEIAESAKEGLLALAVGTGMQVMAAMFDEDVTRMCGPAGKHSSERAGYRHGSEAGSVTLGGRRLPVTRPRVRAADGSGELHLPSYDLFSSTEVLGRLAMEKMLAGLSSRRYTAGLEPACACRESVHGSDQQSCPLGHLAVMITGHVPAARRPPDHAGGRMAAAVPAYGGVADRRDLDPAPSARRPATAAAAPPEPELGGPGLLATLLGVIPKARRRGLRLLVAPDTILRWPHDIARRRWVAKSMRGKTGRPAARRNIRALVLGLAREIPE